MDYNKVLQRARERMAPRCKVCPECNGLGCGNMMPGPGSKAPGNGANDNWRAWRRWCLNMDTIAPNTPVDTSLELLGRTFSLPVIAAPIGSLRAQFHPEDDIRDYNACCIAAAAQTGIAASFGDGLDARVFPHGCALTQQYGGIGLPVINPLSMDTIKANLDLANAAQPFAVSVVIDSAGLPHLKAASPDAGSKTVAELRELCDYAQMPMILKGIMTVRGAEKAVEAGAAGNAAAGTILSLAVAPVGVSRCVNPEGFSGGTDRESDEALRERVLDSFKRMPNGANAAFYEQGALSFEGVAAAVAVPRPRGRGTVDVVVSAPSGTPSAELLAELTDYFEARREIAVDLVVRAPEIRTVDVAVRVAVAPEADPAAVLEAAEQALRSWFNGGRLGQPVLRARLGALLYGVDGVENYAVVTPAADVAAADDVLPVLGTLTVEEMA